MSKNLFVLFLFAACLMLKVSVVAGEEVDASELADASSAQASEEAFPIPSKKEKLAMAQSAAQSGAVISGQALMYDSKTESSLTPIVGGTFHGGAWNNQVHNKYTLGAILEMPISAMVSFETESTYGPYSITYSNQTHHFNQFSLGAGSKVYLTRYSAIRPYVGLGLTGIYYQGMQSFWTNYNTFVGALQASAGAEAKVSQDLALGVRGEWLIPVINRPKTGAPTQVVAQPGYEDASAINSEQFRILGTVKVSL